MPKVNTSVLFLPGSLNGNKKWYLSIFLCDPGKRTKEEQMKQAFAVWSAKRAYHAVTFPLWASKSFTSISRRLYLNSEGKRYIKWKYSTCQSMAFLDIRWQKWPFLRYQIHLYDSAENQLTEFRIFMPKQRIWTGAYEWCTNFDRSILHALSVSLLQRQSIREASIIRQTGHSVDTVR